MARDEDAMQTGRNWWKAAFFVMLLLFECTRELYVVAQEQEPLPPPVSVVTKFGDDDVLVTGGWRRSDGGKKLVPAAVTINCRRQSMECTEANASLLMGFVNAPDVAVYPAAFTPTGVSYKNDTALCVTYFVHIDTAMKRAISVRQIKPNVKDELCSSLEPRMELQISNGMAPIEKSSLPNGVFLPILRIVNTL